MIKDLLKISAHKKRAKRVGLYYDHWSRKFLEITDTFQGFRTENILELHEYTIKSAGLKAEMNILDSGCGVGGPTFYFAKNLNSQIFALTNSKVQIEIITERKEREGVANLNPVHGDYHNCKALFGDKLFDAICFLESLGHSYHPRRVIQQSLDLLRPGGHVYIRDHFIIEGQTPEEKKHIAQLVKGANETYLYNHSTLSNLTRILLDEGFEIAYTKKPEVEFFDINPEFEKRFGIKSPTGHFIDTIEIKAVKP